MEPIVINCPVCGGVNAINMNSLPLSSLSEATPFEANCALCGKNFPFGFVPNPTVPAESPSAKDERIPSDVPSGGEGQGIGHFHPGPSTNDQRSNSLNPNNFSNRAA